MPIVGLTFVSARLVSDSASEAQSAQAITATTKIVNDAIRVQSQITIESFTANAVSSAGSLGIPLSIVAAITGLDLEAHHLDAMQVVDESFAASTFVDTRVLLEEARALVGSDEASTDEIAQAYDRVEDNLTAVTRSGLRELSNLALSAGDAGELTETLRILELSVVLREDVTATAKSYFGARFAIGRSSDAQAEVLFAEATHYDATLEELKRTVPADSPLKDIWFAVDSSPSVVAINENVDELLAAMIAGGTQGPAFGESVSLTDISGNTQIFLDALETIERHVGFVDAVAAELVAAADSVRADAEASRSETTKLAIAFGVAALLACLAASWWIIRPLRHMAGAVRRLQQGKLAKPVREAGPREVRDAARALNEAVDHLNLAEQQALALAGANPDSSVLKQTAPGRLGASLQDAVASLANSMAEREDFRQRLAHEATHDGLTGLANRSSTMAHLEQSLARVGRTDHDLAVLFIDLDGFKSVNDHHGHSAGDRVLRTMSQRIAKAIRLGDHLGRLGGDEFVVIAEPVHNAEEAMTIARRVLEEISQAVPVGEVELVRSASIGIALAGQHDLTADEMLRDADLAVYKAKSEGRSRIEFCDDDLKRSVQTRIDIERKLREALHGEELELHYQPIVDTRTRSLLAVEALLRWPNAPQDVDGPEAFIPVAERSDLIIDVDRWVIASAVKQLATWDSSAEFQKLKVSVNVSARHLGAPSLLDDVLGPLRAAGVDPRRLMLEVTETALLNDLDTAARALAEIRSHGITVAIDDFGTGYTSLSHLRQLPVDVLKIDRSFVSNLQHHDDHSLVRLIVDTGHLLGLSITAEGVETVEQAADLTSLGSDCLQGYLLGRPVPANELVLPLSAPAPTGIAL